MPKVTCCTGQNRNSVSQGSRPPQSVGITSGGKGQGQGRRWGCPGSLRTRRHLEKWRLASRRTRALWLAPSTRRAHRSPGPHREEARNPPPTAPPAGSPFSAQTSSPRGRLPAAQPDGGGGARARRGPLTRRCEPRPAAGLLGSGAARTNRAGGGARLAPERAGRGGEPGRGSEGRGAAPAGRPSPLRPTPQPACRGRRPSPSPPPPPQAPCLLGTLHVTR